MNTWMQVLPGKFLIFHIERTNGRYLCIYSNLCFFFFFCLVAQSCLTLCNPMDCSTPGFLVLNHFPEFAQTHVHRVSDAIQPSHPLSPPSPPAYSLSQHQGISSESLLHVRWPKYWSFSFNVSPSNEYSGLISFRIDLFHLLAVQGTLKSLLQHHCLKASILWCSVFFMVQLSHLHMTIEKPCTFVSKEMSAFYYAV